MRSFAILLAAAAINAAVAQGVLAEGRIRLAQTSTVTNCMMTCNAQAANCQTGCVVPGTTAYGVGDDDQQRHGGHHVLVNLHVHADRVTSCARLSPSP
jgi:hypothetical protein